MRPLAASFSAWVSITVPSNATAAVSMISSSCSSRTLCACAGTATARPSSSAAKNRFNIVLLPECPAPPAGMAGVAQRPVIGSGTLLPGLGQDARGDAVVVGVPKVNPGDRMRFHGVEGGGAGDAAVRRGKPAAAADGHAVIAEDHVPGR